MRRATIVLGSSLAASLSLLAASSAAAQSRVDTAAEVAACAVLDEVTEVMIDWVASEDRWIDNNRPGRNASNSTIERFNERVSARNGVNSMSRRFIDDYNSQCTSNRTVSAVRSVCTVRSDRVSEYLYEGETCRRFRENYAD